LLRWLAGFDIDLTYINSEIIAMGVPATGWVSFYRNPVSAIGLMEWADGQMGGRLGVGWVDARPSTTMWGVQYAWWIRWLCEWASIARLLGR
jgi:hypothetical protein